MITLPDLGNNGRLGNQLFQVAAAFAHCLRTGQTLVVPDFDLTQAIAQRFTRVPREAIPHQPRQYHEPRFAYTPIPADLANASMHGYYQSERYFDDCRDAIHALFHPKDDVILRAGGNPFEQHEARRPVVALCVRRTDYVTSNGFHPVQPIDYYDRATAMFPGATFRVFSDDLPWCERHLPYPNLEFCREKDAWTKLWAMSLCDHHIIANSTYHWWGAWLNRRPGKVVVAPKLWFGPQSGLTHQTADLYPEGWVKL